jgi:3-dehydroquinate synthase
MKGTTVVELNAPSLKGRIYIGNGIARERIRKLARGQKNFVVTDSNVYALYKPFFEETFPETEIFVLPQGEENKTFSSLGKILSRMVEVGLHRSSRVFAVGGGVVGDIGGLAAATYMRGVRLVQVPTTLLAQVDSSVGGKTAVDLDGVKNVVGAFYQPEEVIVDGEFLKTLPPREIKCGLGEIVKYAALNGRIFDSLTANLSRLSELSYLSSLVEECIRHKAGVCERDEKETGERKSLNVGHTTGHAIELSHGLSHGESVLYGMFFETEIAIEKGICEREYGAKLCQIIRTALAVLPHTTPDFSKIAADAEKAKSDKKNTGDGKIALAVAKNKDEWTVTSLSFDEYVKGLQNAVSKLID